MEGYAFLERIIFLALALYIEGAIFPGAVLAMITASFGTSAVGVALAPLFNYVVPLVAIVATVILFVKSIQSA